VAYKTANRMMKRIRTELVNDEDDGPLFGDVEVDETSVRSLSRPCPDSCGGCQVARAPSRSSSGWSSARGVCGCGSSRRAEGPR
jgi:hypothetical protein